MNLQDHAEDLPRYKDFRPTGFDRHIEVDEIENYVVVYQRNRDSSILENCNFESILDSFGGESEQVQVHRFGHWGCGWFELLLVHPALGKEAAEVACAMDGYPVFDEMAYSQACWNAACEDWDRSNLKDRMHYCFKAGISRFAARRDEAPDDVMDYLLEQHV